MGDRRAGNWEMWIATGIDMGAGTGMGMFWVYGLDELTRGFFSPEFLLNMSASADVLAMAKVEVDLATIPEGKNVSWKHMHGERTTEEERKKKRANPDGHTGHHQVARQARLHPAPDRSRDR